MEKEFQARRELVFLILSGIFLGTVTMLNLLGLTRFIQLGPMSVAIGVLPYPITFMCTDLISDFYGKEKARQLVFMGLVLNFFVLGVLWLGNYMPSVPAEKMPPWQMVDLAKTIHMPNGEALTGHTSILEIIYKLTMGSVIASMAAYTLAHYCDVFVFHKIKNKTKGRHLWLRNNVSTLVSQLVDSVTVVSIAFGVALLKGDYLWSDFLFLIVSNYAFKFSVALLDTGPIYLAAWFLREYLGIDNRKNF